MKKKILGFFALLFSVSCLTACTVLEDSFELTEHEYTYVNTSDEYEINDGSIKLYFKENSKTPYVDVYGMIQAMDGFFKSYAITENRFTNGYIFKWRTLLKSYKMICNSTKNTIEVNDTTFFNFINQTIATDYDAFISTESFWYVDGDSVTFDLNKYNFDIISKNQTCYIPLCIFSILFCSTNYVNVYFNGEKVIVVDQFLNVSTTYDEYVSYKTCDLNGKQDDNRVDAYNSLRFAFDYYYGLKNDKEYADFDEACPEEVKQKILNPDPEVFNRGYYDFLHLVLDDLHTSMYVKSFYNDPSEGHGVFDDGNMGDFWIEYYNQEDLLEGILDERFPEGIPYLRFVDDTAIIFFDEFMTGSHDELYDEEDNLKEDAWLYDSYYLFKKCMGEIEEKGNINNIVIDLTVNGGGNLGAMLRVLGFLTNEPVYYAMQDCQNDSYFIDYERVDTNGDGDFDELDGYPGYNWNILTSLNTFSAANYFTAVAKAMGIATIIGEKSGGGACSVLPIVLADGTSIRMSSNNILCTVADSEKENSKYFYSVEHGVEVDKELALENFYNDSMIDNLVSTDLLV